MYGLEPAVSDDSLSTYGRSGTEVAAAEPGNLSMKRRSLRMRGRHNENTCLRAGLGAEAVCSRRHMFRDRDDGTVTTEPKVAAVDASAEHGTEKTGDRRHGWWWPGVTIW